MAHTKDAVPSPRSVRAPRGTERTCKTWQPEAALRILMNNLDPDVAEKPEQLIVYASSGRRGPSKVARPIHLTG